MAAQIDFQTGGIMALVKLLGNSVALSLGRASLSAMTDANYTVPAPSYQNRTLEVPASVTLGAQRNLVLPLTDGAELVIENLSTGGFGVQAIGATGTGTVIANGKVAIVRCDGVNWKRVTADATP